MIFISRFRFLEPKKKQTLSLEVKTDLEFRMKEKGFSVSELARLVGTTDNTILAIIHQKFVPSVYLALCLALALECKVDDMFKLEILKIK